MTVRDDLLKAAIFAEARLDEAMPLERMAGASALSPHHFHRVFAQEFGETPADYVQRLRLDKAAFRLFLHDDPIVQIALDCGYASHETLTRAFRRRFNMAPTEYRKHLRLLVETKKAFPRENEFREFEISNSKVVQLRPSPIAFIRSHGPYDLVDPILWRNLTDHGDQQGWPEESVLLGIGHDAPEITPADKLRFDACITAPAGAVGDGDIQIGALPGLLCGVTTHIGAYSTLSNAYPKIFAQVAQMKGYRMVGLPAIEIYRDRTVDDDRAISTTDIYLPVQPDTA